MLIPDLKIESSPTEQAGLWGKNPFSEGTHAHESWTATNLWAKEHLALLHSELLESMPPDRASPQEFLDHRLRALAETFDIWARSSSISVVPTDEAAGIFEQFLSEIEEAMAANASRFPVSFLREGLYSAEVRRLLHQRKQYWVGRMLREVRKRKESSYAKAAASRDDGAEAGVPGVYKPDAKAERDEETTSEPHEAASRKASQSAPVRAEPGTPPSRKRRPKPDYETALRVAEVLGRVVGEGPWRSKLDDICLELDENAIPHPRTWKSRGHRGWLDASSERELVVKAIEHHLRLASVVRRK